MLLNHVIPPVDPNWLLSSTAQSAAVLVAIVGGFLVSRIISLSAERGTILQRHQELISRQSIKQVEYDEVHTDRFAISRRWFIEHHQDELIAARGEVDVDSLLEWIPVGSTQEELRPAAEELINVIQTAFSEIRTKFTGSSMPPEASQELEASGLSIPDGFGRVYELVADSIARDRSARYGLSLRWNTPISFQHAASDIVYQRQDARIDLERQLGSELRALSGELELLDEQLRRFKKPEGVKGTIAALTYLALVGIVLPTILMALRPVPDDPVSRIAVVAAFVSGLGVLLGYFLIRARALKPPDPANTSSTPQRDPS